MNLLVSKYWTGKIWHIYIVGIWSRGLQGSQHVTVAINENHLSFMLLPTANLLSVFKSRCIFVVVVLSLFLNLILLLAVIVFFHGNLSLWTMTKIPTFMDLLPLPVPSRRERFVSDYHWHCCFILASIISLVWTLLFLFLHITNLIATYF